MKKGLGRLLALGLALTALLTACTRTEGDTAEFDAGAYVDGVLKATYLGEFDPDYLDMVGLTEAEAEAEYHNGIHMEMNNFYTAYSFETNTAELEEGVEELYLAIYSHASLTVTGVESREDGSFLVTVEVEPIDIVQQVHGGDFAEVKEKFKARYPQEVQNTMTTEEYNAFDAAWAQLILKRYQEKLETIGYLPARTVTLRVEKDSQGYYDINREDFLALDKLVIDYTLPEENGDGEDDGPEESPAPTESGEPQESPAPDEGEAVQTGGQPPESEGPQESQPPESAAPQESEQPSESPAPQESIDPNAPTPPTTGTPVPGVEPE